LQGLLLPWQRQRAGSGYETVHPLTGSQLVKVSRPQRRVVPICRYFGTCDRPPGGFIAVPKRARTVTRVPDVDGGHLRAEALRDRDGHGPHPASDVERAALPDDRHTLQQPLCRGPAAWLDDAFPGYPMKTYGSRLSASAASRRRRCWTDTLTLSVTEDGCRLVADPFPERGGASQLGVWD